ncbi:MAG: alpha/beta hydrolase [Deltaproteobacteria bacterium]|nr:alpha/beta hydrolase [Deltaproteobacteria bacterium]
MSHALEGWRSQGRWLDIHGLQVFVVESGPTSHERPPLVVLHGFPTSSHDFEPTLALLSRDRRVVLLDFPGFGLSAKPRDYSYSLLEQAEVAVLAWQRLGLRRAHLLAHDYGTSVATELLARRERDLLPFEFDSVTLCNGSMHIELAQLQATQQLLRSSTLGPWVARLATKRFFRARMRSIFGSPDAVSDARIDAMWAGIREADGHLRLPAISRYLDERTQFWSRWIGALRRLTLPTHVLWGKRDPVAVAAIAETLHGEITGSTLTWLDDLGHYPMLEQPRAWAQAVDAFIIRHDDGDASSPP